MKKIKIKICDFDPENQTMYGYHIVNILKKYYEIEFSENPDYVFYNESTFEYLNHDCIRIYYTGENLHPNFNLCDYAIAFDHMSFGDRYYRLPIYFYLGALVYGKKELTLKGMGFLKQEPFTADELKAKTDFCSFVYSNYLGDGKREEFFHKLSEYKKVNAGGKYLNNVGGRVPDKLAFESKHKFSIAFENSSNPGYTTEKLPDAISSRTIPIYWGNPLIASEFNEKRFINCHAFKDFDAVIARIREIDNDDALFLQIMNEPIENPAYTFADIQSGFEAFLRNIFDQPLDEARRRRINPVRMNILEQNERLVAKASKARSRLKGMMAKAYKPFKKLRFMESVKQAYFKKRVSKK